MQKLKWAGENQKLSIGVIKEFHAAHWLNDYEGKCANIHGHTWRIECVIKGERLNKQGFVIDFGIVKEALDNVLQEFDHSIINFVVPQPTAENIAFYIYDKMYRWIRNYTINKTGIKYFLEKIVVWETTSNFFEIVSCDYNYEMWHRKTSNENAKKISSMRTKEWQDNKESRCENIRKSITKETKEKCSKRMKENNPMMIRSNVEKMMISLRKTIKIKPNLSEKELMGFFKENELDYSYVGDASFLIDGKNPDFVNFERKEIIELFGEFWHSDNNPWYNTSNDEDSRKSFFESKGWRCLIIWDYELKNKEVLLNKVNLWRDK